MGLLLGANFVLACVGIIFFGANDPQHFGDLPRAMMTVWICETLDDWETVLYINMFGCDMYSALIPLLQRQVLCVDTTASTPSTLR